VLQRAAFASASRAGNGLLFPLGYDTQEPSIAHHVDDARHLF